MCVIHGAAAAAVVIIIIIIKISSGIFIRSFRSYQNFYVISPPLSPLPPSPKEKSVVIIFYHFKTALSVIHDDILFLHEKSLQIWTIWCFPFPEGDDVT